MLNLSIGSSECIVPNGPCLKIYTKVISTIVWNQIDFFFKFADWWLTFMKRKCEQKGKHWQRTRSFVISIYPISFFFQSFFRWQVDVDCVDFSRLFFAHSIFDTLLNFWCASVFICVLHKLLAKGVYLLTCVRDNIGFLRVGAK